MNLKEIQKRLDQMQNPTKGKFVKVDRSITFFKPEIGKHLVRFVPYKENKENPFKELYFHYGIGPKAMLSPISYGEKDPIVDFANALKKSKDPEDWKLSKKLQPKLRTFALVVDRNDESKGPRWYEFGKSVYQELLSLAADEDIGDFTDVIEGRDIKVDVTQGANYKETSVRPTMKHSKLHQDIDVVEKWCEDQPDLEGNYIKYTFEQIKGFLEKWLDPETNNTESSTPVVKQESKEKITTGQFDSLFGKDDSDEMNDLPWDEE